MKQKSKIPKNWKYEIVDNILNNIEYGTSKIDYELKTIKIVGMKDFEDGKININNLDFVNIPKRDKNKLLLKKGDILLNRTNSYDLVGKVAIYNSTDKAVFASYLVRLNIKKEIINPYFLNYFFNLKENQLKIKSIATKAVSQANINPTQFRKKCFVLYPIKLKEQEKIVEILELWDKAIETTKKLIKQKELQKKYLMQKLLTGKIRLKGFKDKWEKKIVKDFGIVVTGNTPSKTNINYYGDVLPWVTAEDFSSKYILNTKIKLSELGKQQARVLPKGSVLITCIASIGLNAIAGTELATNQQINSIIPNKKYNSDFLYYLFSFNTSYIKAYASPGGLSILPKSVFEKIVFKIPTNIVEQKAIADILSTADNQINLLEQKLSNLELQKKGLMQKLLTGQIRVC